MFFSSDNSCSREKYFWVDWGNINNETLESHYAFFRTAGDHQHK